MSLLNKLIQKASYIRLAEATSDEATTAVQNLRDFLETIISIAGAIVALYGVVQIGLSISSQDHTQRTTGIMALLGGLLIAFAPSVLKTIGV
ncbi:MAG: glutamyl-tRNA amidotransferase [Saccharofermentanales bacterium]|jgi:hypothetical protein